MARVEGVQIRLENPHVEGFVVNSRDVTGTRGARTPDRRPPRRHAPDGRGDGGTVRRGHRGEDDRDDARTPHSPASGCATKRVSAWNRRPGQRRPRTSSATHPSTQPGIASPGKRSRPGNRSLSRTSGTREVCIQSPDAPPQRNGHPAGQTRRVEHRVTGTGCLLGQRRGAGETARSERPGLHSNATNARCNSSARPTEWSFSTPSCDTTCSNAMTVIKSRGEFLEADLEGEQREDAATIVRWSEDVKEIVPRVRTVLETLTGEGDPHLEAMALGPELGVEIDRLEPTYPRGLLRRLGSGRATGYRERTTRRRVPATSSRTLSSTTRRPASGSGSR